MKKIRFGGFFLASPGAYGARRAARTVYMAAQTSE
ncbi:MAG: hypothetical protein JWQ01_126 [Massilia sp.]|nr:hypothetical protein [Massilia sp.]